MTNQYIDLTHSIHPGIPTWDLSCGFHKKTLVNYDDCGAEGEVKFHVQAISTPLGIGTHMDAPAHCFAGAKSIDELALENFIVPCVVINISEKAHEHYQLSISDIERFEQQQGRINPGSLVVVHTGWSQHWNNPKQYHNNLKFPSISESAAQCLFERDIAGLGIDTLSPDAGDSDFGVHRIILGAGKYIIENIVNADKLPATGSTVMAFPLKIEEGTESPLRLVASL